MDLKSLGLGIVSIATRDYLSYWKSQANSIDRNIKGSASVSLYLFTDKVQEAELFAQSLSNLSTKVFEIPSLGWPDATLLRYRIISKAMEFLKTETVLMYLDADMLVTQPLDVDQVVRIAVEQMVLVRHPGFYRPRGTSALIMYVKHPKLLFADLLMRVMRGGLGSWESRPRSAAFVTRSKRIEYICGGIWWGKTELFLKLASELEDSVDADLSSGVMAVFHDESHLNMWSTKNPHFLESPEYCFAEGYPWLEGMNPKILAVEKGTKKTTKK